MRPIFRGAAAVAALCAGALAVPSAAFAYDSGSDAADGRLAGRDRVQTSLEALQGTPNVQTVVIVGYNGVVDALSVPELVKCNDGGNTAVVYSMPDGLDKRTVDALKAVTTLEKVYIAGGYGVVPASVERQVATKVFGVDAKKRLLSPLDLTDIVRLNGINRFETSYLLGALAQDCTLANEINLVEYANYMIEELPKLKAEYDAAKAAYKAATKAAEGAQDALIAANEKFAALVAEAAKVENVNVDDAIAEIQSAKVNAQELAKLQEGKKLLDALVDYANNLKVETGQTSWGDRPASELFTYLEEVDEVPADVQKAVALAKGADFKAAKVADVQKNATLAGDSDYTLDIVKALAIKQGEAITAHVKAHPYTSVAEVLGKLLEANALKDQLADPNSPIQVAATAVRDAETALDNALKAQAAADKKLIAARDIYAIAIGLSFDNFQVDDHREAVAKKVADTYKRADFPIFVSTGMNFADALTAGPAAAKEGGVVLLTNGAKMEDYVADAVAKSKKPTYAIGGPAAQAVPLAKAIVGKDRYETAVKVALHFWPGIANADFALASGQTGADAVVAGTFNANTDNQMAGVLLTLKDKVHPALADYVQYGDHSNLQKPVGKFVVFGGEGVISRNVVNELRALTHN